MAGADREPLAHVTRDTLPGGAVSVMSDGPTAWRDSSGWRLVETSRITGGDSAAGDCPILTGAVIDPPGRPTSPIRVRPSIKVFDRAGHSSVPLAATAMAPANPLDPFSALHGPESRGARSPARAHSVFDTAGAFLRSWPSICCHYSAISIDDAGRVAVRTTQQDAAGFTSAFIRYTMDGKAADTIPVPNDGQPKLIELSHGGNRMRMGIPFSSQPVEALRRRWISDPWLDGDYRLTAAERAGTPSLIFGRRGRRCRDPTRPAGRIRR